MAHFFLKKKKFMMVSEHDGCLAAPNREEL